MTAPVKTPAMTSAPPTVATLRDRLEEYLVLRRALGFQLNDVERQVGLFYPGVYRPEPDILTWLTAL